MTYLAHGGEMTGDELAGVGFGIAFAMLFPAAALFVVARRVRKSSRASAPQAGGGDATGAPDAAEREETYRLGQAAGPAAASQVGLSGHGSKEIL
ncbi:hypothetical protein MSM1_06325 [Mycobacterium sp. SM1]|uniref:hypothetical protein n=1 Tax=Mycobacterium sp. SM1 TaxID=2816243 RepID=UPI001BCF48B3|nr:hypothetical protein [Mycobacterium sp. SM1]MBS4727980.1 hypothetical protein [Mycobacterium sp. SM1]